MPKLWLVSLGLLLVLLWNYRVGFEQTIAEVSSSYQTKVSIETIYQDISDLSLVVDSNNLSGKKVVSLDANKLNNSNLVEATLSDSAVRKGGQSKPSRGRGSVPWLMTKGNWLVDEKEQKVQLRGVSALKNQEIRKWIQMATNEQNGWYSNVFRIPIYKYQWKKGKQDWTIKNILDPGVDECIKQKIYCIVDWHAIENWNTKEAEQDLLSFWKRVAPRYQDVSNVIYEMFNEPVRPWGNIQHWKQWRQRAQPWVNFIRERAHNNIILIGSPRFAYYPRYAAIYPFEGRNLAYVFHLYPCRGNSVTELNWLLGIPATKIPIFLSEIGWQNERKACSRGTTTKHGQMFKKYLQQRPYIGWTAWSFGIAGSNALLAKKNSNYVVRGGNDNSGAVFKDWIAEDLRNN